LLLGHVASGRSQIKEESRVELMTLQRRRHARHSDTDINSDVMTSGVIPSSAVTFKSAASYVVTRIQLYATFSIYFKVRVQLLAERH